jgi:hypothetical protein
MTQIDELKRIRSILSAVTGFQEDDQEYIDDARKAVDALIEQALAAPVQEPVGYTDGDGRAWAVKWSGALPPNLTLFTAPPAAPAQNTTRIHIPDRKGIILEASQVTCSAVKISDATAGKTYFLPNEGMLLEVACVVGPMKDGWHIVFAWNGNHAGWTDFSYNSYLYEIEAAPATTPQKGQP